MTVGTKNHYMLSIKQQFQFQSVTSHFEVDTHTELQGLHIDKLRVLAGESADKDILVLQYKGSPLLSFYDAGGRLLDVDHYLPENYRDHDDINVEAIISNLKNADIGILTDKKRFDESLKEMLEAGNQDLVAGLGARYGLQTSWSIIDTLLPALQSAPSAKAIDGIKNAYSSLYDLLHDIVLSQQKASGYVHITPEDNVVITPLNKRSGLAVIIETQDVHGQLLPAHKWNIIRCQSSTQLEQSLVFRTDDVTKHFSASTYSETFQTERYKLYYDDMHLSLDSCLDNTDNLLKMTVLNGCYKVMSSDHNIVTVLTNERELTIVNTHKSVVPHKWPKKVVFPQKMTWVRTDENMSLAFCQAANGVVSCYDISEGHPEKVTDMGSFAQGFEIDQHGHLICQTRDTEELILIKTNLQDLQFPSQQQSFSTIFKNLSHLFKGESLFVKTRFAKPIADLTQTTESKLPTAIEKARYDFETNVENMLINSNNSYEDLLTLQQKMAIARQNITEELLVQADKEGVILIGQRLKSTVNSIMLPAELRVRNLIEDIRANTILLSTRSHRAKAEGLEDPNTFREILNQLRSYREELESMLPENTVDVLGEFKELHDELNLLFSEEISKEGNALHEFITSEIEEIESEINSTHDSKILENLLGTHPAAMELFTLLKQPFILENIAKEKTLSPAAIQSRLFKAVTTRKLALANEQERAEAQKNEAKRQLEKMIKESIDFFVANHSTQFSDLELSINPTYQNILSDIAKLEKTYADVRLAMDLRRILGRRILEQSRTNLEKRITFEGKYAFIKNDPHLFIDIEAVDQDFPKWHLDLIEKKGSTDKYLVTFIKETDKEVYRPSTTENLRSGKAFELDEADYSTFFSKYDLYVKEEYTHSLLEALWNITEGNTTEVSYPQFATTTINVLLPADTIGRKALRCALEKKTRDELESTRHRNVPEITPEFVDHTPYLQHKLHEFILKAKIQLASGSGILLLTGPPSTGKSAFLKYAASIMNREYFEHASDKWQTKNSLVTAIRFGEFGPYSVPAGFTKAITTPNSLINIEEIKEWPEALRKSLNPFFAGSKVFLSPDGTRYTIADNILLCAATNLGSIYRQDDEPFTADFWSRIEVVEYDYAPLHVSREYYNAILNPKMDNLLTVQDLVRKHFMYHLAPKRPEDKAVYFSKQFLEFILLPKADEHVKRTNLTNYINEYFAKEQPKKETSLSPEEAVKVSMRRLPDFQGYTPVEFYDLYDHFVNGQKLRTKRLAAMKTRDNDLYEHYKVLILSIAHVEGCLRSLREVFYTSAGQTEIEGTNREFIKCIYLLGLMGKM